MVLEKGAILQTSATVIVGVLILLTFNVTSGKLGVPQISAITATIVFPFGVSVIAAGAGFTKLGTRVMIAGFAYLYSITCSVVTKCLTAEVRRHNAIQVVCGDKDCSCYYPRGLSSVGGTNNKGVFRG
jgi:hypothetical protein